ncbi:MAG: hypothetical protein ACLT46_12060 [Hungatella sp.]
MGAAVLFVLPEEACYNGEYQASECRKNRINGCYFMSGGERI